jgi:hypothetical protein
MAERSVWYHVMVAEGALVYGTQLPDRSLRLEVFMVSLEGDPVHLQSIKGIRELQQFCLGIDAGALERGRNPGVPDLSSPMTHVDIDQPCRTYKAVLSTTGGKRYPCDLLLAWG